jgi:leucyl aminopeptidase (aminopeptidase T)
MRSPGSSGKGRAGRTFHSTRDIAFSILSRMSDQLQDDAAVHTDFMIGGPDFAVDGVTRDGDVTPLLREDVWQL